MFEELYAGFPEVPRIRTTVTTAEMIKYSSNALLATMISFSNELADLCAAVGGVDVVDVMKGLHSSMYLTVDGRQAPITSFLEAGCGFGGSCLPKDVNALIERTPRRWVGRGMKVLKAVIEVNEDRVRRGAAARPQPRAIARRHERETRPRAGGGPGHRQRGQVAEEMLPKSSNVCSKAGASVRAHDPVVRRLPERLENTGVQLGEENLANAVARGQTSSCSSPVGTSTTSCRTHSPGWIPSRFSWTVGVCVDPERVARYDGIGRSAEAAAVGPRRPSRVP